MGGEFGVDAGTLKFNNTLKEVNKAVENKRIVEKEGVMSIDLSGRVKSDADLERYSEVVKKLKDELESKIGSHLETVPVVVISDGDGPLSMGTCANLSDIWRDKDGKIKDETIILVSPDTIETEAEIGGVDYEVALEGKLRHELTHAIVNKYCQERGLDIHDGDSRIFSELMAVMSENKVLGNTFKEVFNFYLEDQGVERIPEEFPRMLWYDQVYIQFPIFWDKLSKEMDSPDLVLDLFKKWVEVKGGGNFLDMGRKKIDQETLDVLKMSKLISNKAVTTGLSQDIVDGNEKDLDTRSKQVIGKLFAVIHGLEKSAAENGRGVMGNSESFKEMEKPLSEEIIIFLEDQLKFGNGGLDKKWEEWRRELGE